ncbi:MAG: hypothetical protein IPH07_24205 [Deltaproteobacteria bacterium]|nr:hypothetical protein [Deltaproteobacteria bacterium]
MQATTEHNLRTSEGRANLDAAIKKLFKGNAKLTSNDLAETFGLGLAQIRASLHRLIDAGVLVAIGNTKARVYMRAPST